MCSRAEGQSLDKDSGRVITKGIPTSAFLMVNMQSCGVQLDKVEGITDLWKHKSGCPMVACDLATCMKPCSGHAPQSLMPMALSAPLRQDLKQGSECLWSTSLHL